MVGLGGCAAGSPSEPVARPVALMVIPHPDDELGATAVVEPLRAAGYDLVMLLVTDGEATQRCGDERGTTACASRRVAAWEDVAESLGIDDADRRRAGLADGGASPAAVSAAICATVGDLKAEGRPVEVLVAAAYHGGDGEAAVVYEHPDHDATNQALITADCVAVPRLVRIPASDAPELVLTADTDVHERLMGDGGVAQQAYGWLAFDFVSGDTLPAWVNAETDRMSPFGREQGFACWDADGAGRDRSHCVIGEQAR